MNIEYRNDKFKRQLENEKTLVASFGLLNARKISRRIRELEAAENLSDLVTGRPHPHVGSRKGLFSLDIQHPLRLIIRPTGEFDLNNYKTITSIEIYEIMDPH